MNDQRLRGNRVGHHLVIGYDSAVPVGPAHGATDRRCVTASENHCEEQRDHGNRYSAHGTQVTTLMGRLRAPLSFRLQIRRHMLTFSERWVMRHVMADERCLTFNNLHAIPHVYVKKRMLGRTSNSLDSNIQRRMLALFLRGGSCVTSCEAFLSSPLHCSCIHQRVSTRKSRLQRWWDLCATRRLRSSLVQPWSRRTKALASPAIASATRTASSCCRRCRAGRIP